MLKKILLARFKLELVGASGAKNATDYDKTMVWSPAASKPAGAAVASVAAPMAAAASPHPEAPLAAEERGGPRTRSSLRAA